MKGGNTLQAFRIDKFLFSTEWNDSLPSSKQLALPIVISNHKPLLLENGVRETTSSYFKFENMWLQQKGFINMLKGWWQNYIVGGSPDFILTQKLRNLKKDTTILNKEVYGRVEETQSRALAKISALEKGCRDQKPHSTGKAKVY